jgi:hypothetical protein
MLVDIASDEGSNALQKVWWSKRRLSATVSGKEISVNKPVANEQNDQAASISPFWTSRASSMASSHWNILVVSMHVGVPREASGRQTCKCDVIQRYHACTTLYVNARLPSKSAIKCCKNSWKSDTAPLNRRGSDCATGKSRR